MTQQQWLRSVVYFVRTHRNRVHSELYLEFILIFFGVGTGGVVKVDIYEVDTKIELKVDTF